MHWRPHWLGNVSFNSLLFPCPVSFWGRWGGRGGLPLLQGTEYYPQFSNFSFLTKICSQRKSHYRLLRYHCVFLALGWESLVSCEKTWVQQKVLEKFPLGEKAVQALLLFSCSIMSDSLQPHGLQHSRFPCPSPSHGVCSNTCPLSPWCHPTISSSVIPFFSCLLSFPASVSFTMSQLFASGGQSIGVSASASVLPMNIQDWFPLGWTGWISFLSKRLSRAFSNTTV